jgi:hypothetical protein
MCRPLLVRNNMNAAQKRAIRCNGYSNLERTTQEGERIWPCLEPA